MMMFDESKQRFILFFYFKNFVIISSYKHSYNCWMHIINNTKQSMKQIIKLNNGDELRQAEQVHDTDAYTRPTLQILVITV